MRRHSTQQRRERLLGVEARRRRPAAEGTMLHPRPRGAVQLIVGVAEQEDLLSGPPETAWQPTADVVDDAENPDHRRRVDRGRTGLVVEADVATGHRRTQ